MKAPITERIREYVLKRGLVTTEQVAEALPELAQFGGTQRALLLMRLDPLLERAGTNQWAARSMMLTDTRKVQRAAEEYFRSLARQGAPLTSAVSAIARSSRVESRKVEEILRDRYVVAGTNVFNKMRHG